MPSPSYRRCLIAVSAAICTAVTAVPVASAAGSNGGFSSSTRTTSATKKARHLGDRVPLRRGMKGHDVKILQDFLKRAGQRVSIDGSFGTGTVRAVRGFERAQQRRTDGIVDAGDIDALRSAAAAGATTPAQTPQPAPGDKATVGPDGLAMAPAGAPDQVKAIIAAGNEIATKPYRYGGGHGSWQDSGYDCSGSVSYALHGAGLLDQSMPSGGFTGWGDTGPGQWVTVYAKSSHMYMVVAGLRFDTSGRSDAGTRWQAAMRPTDGYAVRHPAGL